MDTINVLIKLYRINDWFISKCSSLGTSYPIKSYSDNDNHSPFAIDRKR